MSETDVLIIILADDIPELSEELTVTLTGIEPIATQRLKPGATIRKLIISENDNPGGTFQFSDSLEPSYTLEVKMFTVFSTNIRTLISMQTI